MKRTRTAEEMQQYAIEVVSSLSPQERSATVVALSGELGAGKTTFVQGAAKALGITEQVTSPTFVLEKIYQLEGQPFDKAQGKKFERLIHIDAYRLKSAHELEILGWETLLQDPANLILIEWPERVQEAIPKDAILITFDISADERIITLTYVEKKEN
ncbi:tRNA (adenosine(37)-N6)-threonylcarbamoyltransferase complex ATPase subunit type 1 TsaE [Candidatus Kaiserbacteria bacterium RIFCSPHIGHO2_01_FULL_54_36]|uniref:tRNA threonylcarbamoyladenosine biosynthesis protein TsaE n=1 Tax=Candidatus Kaiserbacteria bacterium RIFCSPHIGHO2_01_FULL_54_36 TaxID=1798482 RepID=A0A1F6CNZ8_9BACT|nr:MAG: tRNA (adenosine(37)-N6)-threonylcarbamoyltransferase complex ATPase subunit type 1 TsaE [Candidatus Kaiserbacteria bacterium RIFCSPHIGHO2_01_FULL_54_36]OGG75228.1 MAG: tRNA (adenosine(37)-N6)-threonylcarbamoyltransferase complex ATPase subunit type 1 TsaE [Candidatus Kaiserbacteria bacterium RIFCSPLOWO2_01_FULL_54_22]